MSNRHRFERAALIGLVLLAFLPRVIYPVSRPLQWYFRSAEFFQAVLRRDWSGTLFSEHPGVTVMWLSGAALWGWYGLQSRFGGNPPTPLETEGYAFADRVGIGIVPLALIAAVGILWGWHLLERLFGKRVAWIATVLFALDPFYLANSKTLHLDATLATLMLLSALSMLLYLREHKQRDLLISSTLGGLAILTKVTALFLVPFWGLCLAVDWLTSLHGRETILRCTLSVLRSFGLWLLVALVLCFALWPSLWVQPRATFDLVVRKGILDKVASAHGLPRFYGDALTVGDPGIRYYVDTLLFRTTFLTLPFSLVGLGILLSSRRRGKAAILLALFALLYFAQMAVAGRKEARYMLPSILILDVISAWGIVWWSERAGRLTAHRSALAALLLLMQAFIVISHHPYYGAHYNALMGGAEAAQRVFPLADFGEGLDLAGRYVEDQSHEDSPLVGTQFLANEMVAQYVRGPVRDINETGSDADYLVFGVQYTMRGKGFPRWGALWERVYRFREPAFSALFDGIPYAWVYVPGSQPVVSEQSGCRLGEQIELIGYRLADETLSPGDTLLLTLHWQAASPVPEHLTVFTHLQNSEGEVVAQQDGVPAGGDRPTSSWKPGRQIEDGHAIPIPPGTPYDTYSLSVGMYDPETLVRLPAFDADGNRLPDDRIPLTTIRLRPAVPPWRWALTGSWLMLIALGAFWPVRNRRGSRTSESAGE